MSWRSIRSRFRKPSRSSKSWSIRTAVASQRAPAKNFACRKLLSRRFGVTLRGYLARLFEVLSVQAAPLILRQILKVRVRNSTVPGLGRTRGSAYGGRSFTTFTSFTYLHYFHPGRAQFLPRSSARAPAQDLGTTPTSCTLSSVLKYWALLPASAYCFSSAMASMIGRNAVSWQRSCSTDNNAGSIRR